MKKEFLAPSMEVNYFAKENVVTSSGATNTSMAEKSLKSKVTDGTSIAALRLEF